MGGRQELSRVGEGIRAPLPRRAIDEREGLVRSEKAMNVESQIGDLVRALASELTEMIRDTALQRVRELLGDEGAGPDAFT